MTEAKIISLCDYRKIKEQWKRDHEGWSDYVELKLDPRLKIPDHGPIPKTLAKEEDHFCPLCKVKIDDIYKLSGFGHHPENGCRFSGMFRYEGSTTPK